MNRVFKVIWNRTKGCYVVVAETAKNMTKRSSLSVVFSKMVGATAVAVMLTGVMMPTDVLGAPITRGNGAQAENDGGIAIGDNTASKGDYSISIGTNASVGRGDTDEGKTQSGIAIGQGATVTVDPVKGKDVDPDQRTGGIAIGQGATTKVVNAIAVGSGTSADGAQAVTIGHNSRSITNNSVALGNETRVASLNGFALGNNARAGYDETNKLIGLPNDQAFGSNARAYGGTSMAFGNDAITSGGGAISIGNAAQSRGDWAIAIGNGSKALKQGSSALGTNATTNSSHSTALGWGSTTNGYADIAAGDGSVASGGNSLALGVQSSTSNGAVGAVALGLSSKAEKTNSMALGVSANAAHERSVALGANSKTDATVSTANQLVNGLWYKNYAGGSADSTLSVGSDTVKRTITNVAAGRVNAQSTDAINGSQLYGVANTLGNLASTTKGLLGGNAALDPDTGNLSMSNIGNTGKGTIHDAIKFNKDTIDKGLNFAGDTGTVSNRQLGDTVTVKGGATGTLSDGNIGVVSDGNGTLNVKLAKTLTGLDSVTAGNTKIDNGGLTVGGKNYVSTTGLNANNQKITNVADGSSTNDAVNYGQLQAAIGGTAKASTVKAKDANVTVTESTNAAGGKEYTVGLGNKITVGTANPVTVDGDAGHVTGLTNTDWNVDNPVAVSGRGATEDQLKKVNDKVNTNKTAIDKGLNFDGDSGAVINKKLGEKLSVKGGATGTLSDGNIGVESDGNGTLNVKLAKTLSGLDSVTAGGTTINNSGLTVGGKTYVSPTGINANDQKVTNVANGDVSANSKDAVNGGQLHDAKNELINKGLRFDADNNDVKTNKLGSKVTVNGDGNITTEITQTGDDTTIGVKLNKNLNVQTLTATDTVKAGGVTMGKHADSNNYVTGLDNKDWDVNTTNPVSGRAATEDQLKKISDVVKNQGAAATDYRLVKNTAAADNAYTVDSNGDVDLTVEDKNHAGKKETVKIKDVASKSSLDKLNDRAVKYDLDNNGAVDKTKVTYEGSPYANKTGGTHVTNVAYATGNNGSEAVNVDYLKDRIKDSEDALTNKGLKFDANSGGVKTNKLGSTVTVKGEGTDADANYSGENLKTFIKQDQDGNTTIDVKMNKNLKANSVAIAGKNGQDGVTLKGGDAKNGVDGTSINRLVTEDKDGNTHTLATLDDGMMYGGDIGNVIKKKLNNQVNVKGGITDESKLATEDNIGVVSDGSDTLKLRLAKELKGLTSATFTNGGNNTVINGDGMTINRAGGNAVSLTKDGLNNGGNKITNVADGTDPNDAVNKSQLDKATAAASTTVSAGNNITVTPSTNANGSKNYEVSLKDQVTLGSDATKQIAMDGTTGTIKAGDKVTIDGNKGTIKAGNVTIDGENGTIKAGDKVTIDGKDGKIAAGKVSVDGKDGYVTGLENKDWDPNNITSGRAATEDQLQKSHKSLDNKINNLGDEITKKGMNFAGNTGEFHRDLGQKVTIKGEGTEADDKYSGENIKTVADQNGNVTIKMAKNLKTDSLTTDKVKVGKNGKDGVSITGPNGVDGTDGKVGITGKDGKDAVSMSGKDGIGHIGLTGKDGRNADITVDKGDPDLDGNNITRIKYQDENGKTHQVATKDDGMKYGGDSGSVIKKKLNEQVNVVGGITDASKLTTEDNLGVVSDGTGNLKVRMAKDLKGLETVTTKDAAGNTTVMNGGGVTITPASGNAVSLTKDGLNNGGNTITNVGPGVNGTDAVNVNQLKGATDGLANAINSVAGETQRVGAHAAAMSALKPIQYDPLEPTQVMAGIGNYRGETAAALGVAHYTAEDTMFHVGVSVGSHHNMVNAGVTRKFGTSDAKKAVPERYKGGPISSMYVMQDEMTALKAKYEKVQRDNEEMRAQIALLMQQAGLK